MFPEWVRPDSVLEFWFSEPARSHWFRSTAALDATIRERFHEVWERAAAGELDGWTATAEGALALVIVLDQLPLNMFRGRPESFATEAAARQIARAAIARGQDAIRTGEQRGFLYMPLMHSEALADQELAAQLYEAAGLENNLKWAHHHRDLIRRFGRFPHRNAILGRESTPAERAYLASDAAFHG